MQSLMTVAGMVIGFYIPDFFGLISPNGTYAKIPIAMNLFLAFAMSVVFNFITR